MPQPVHSPDLPFAPGPARDLFSLGGDGALDELTSLQLRLRKYASGLSRPADFIPAAHAGHAVGVEINELTRPATEQLAMVVNRWRTPVFCDSGAFGVFMRNLRRAPDDPPEIQDFGHILDLYDDLTRTIHNLNDAEQRLPPVLLVMPDIVGDQIGSLELVEKHRAYIAHCAFFRGVARPIIPLQQGPLTLSEAYSNVVGVLGTDDFIVGLPSNAAAIPPHDFIDFLRASRPKAVHILGAFADSRLGPRLRQILQADVASALSLTADANPLRSIIIKKGQGRHERQAALRFELGKQARLQELADWIASFGGLAGLQSEYQSRDQRGRRRMTGLISDLTNLSETEAAEIYQLTTPYALAA